MINLLCNAKNLTLPWAPHNPNVIQLSHPRNRNSSKKKLIYLSCKYRQTYRCPFLSVQRRHVGAACGTGADGNSPRRDALVTKSVWSVFTFIYASTGVARVPIPSHTIRGTFFFAAVSLGVFFFGSCSGVIHMCGVCVSQVFNVFFFIRPVPFSQVVSLWGLFYECVVCWW